MWAHIHCRDRKNVSLINSFCMEVTNTIWHVDRDKAQRTMRSCKIYDSIRHKPHGVPGVCGCLCGLQATPPAVQPPRPVAGDRDYDMHRPPVQGMPLCFWGDECPINTSGHNVTCDGAGGDTDWAAMWRVTWPGVGVTLTGRLVKGHVD